ncbi:sugar O-acetyltransferase [Planctobacterium marinum]|uniref:sugar O-acetyltransferase n=1 Tax=Planctobacterium marinum TaxID=1631968 RepID=UPI001E4F49B8|nr:sugar O-acetyltransferase [Planctobacterium marinum]MCC2604568.1 sugar O-acetyltransferase [Planctobacterium marinum]
MNEKQKMISGEMYSPGDPELVELRRQCRLKLEKLNSTSQTLPDERAEIIKSLFGRTGQQIYIESDFKCDYGMNIHVGENFYANFGCVLLDVAPITFGDNCMLAPQVGIYTASHPLTPNARNSGKEFASPISFGDNCWVGGMAVVNPGVKIGDNVVIASGAVVTKSFPDNVVVAGNPARIIKEIDPLL